MAKKINKIKHESGLAFIPILIYIAATAVVGALTATAATKLKSDFLGSIVVGVANIILYGTDALAHYSSVILQNIITSKLVNTAILKSSTFTAGWASVRDLANMAIVLMLVVIGIATALRIQQYAAKQVLWRLVLVAIVINFSGVFCGLFIDAANIIMNSLLGAGGAGDTGLNICKGIESVAYGITAPPGTETLTSLLEGQKYDAYLMQCVTYGLMFFMLAISMLYMCIILIARYAMIAILYILSPIAFAFWIFPGSRFKKYHSEWWESFMKWVFVGVFGCFFLNISAGLLAGYGQSPKSLDLMVVTIFLYVGFKMAQRASGITSQAIMGMAAAVAMPALGGLSKVAGVTGLKGLAQRGGQGIKDAATSAGEKMRLVDRGTTASNKASRLAEPSKRLEAISDNKELAKIAEQRAFTAPQMAEKAAAAQILAKRNAFGAVDPMKRDAVAAHAQSFGVSKETFAKASPTIGATATDEEAIEKVRQDKIDHEIATTPGMTFKGARKKHGDYEPNPIELADAHQAIRKKRIQDNALGVTPVTDDDAKNHLMEKEHTRLVSSGLSHEQASDSLKANIKSGKFKITDKDVAATRGQLSQEKTAKAVIKLSPAKAAELPKEAVTMETMKLFSAQQLEEIGKKGGGDLTAEIAKYKGKLNSTGKAYEPPAMQSAEFNELATHLATLTGREETKLKNAMLQLASDANVV